MVKVSTYSATVPLPADTFWALRLDTNFDRFCAAAEGCTFALTSLSRGADGHVSIETELSANESPLPSALQTLLGAKKFSLLGKARWHVDRHDKAHAATFESSPRIMGDRVCIRGQSWLEPASGGPGASTGNSCTVSYRIEIEVKIMAFASILEQGLERRMRESYARLPELTAAYMRTDAFKAFCAGRVRSSPCASPQKKGKLVEPSSAAAAPAPAATALTDGGGSTTGGPLLLPRPPPVTDPEAQTSEQRAFVSAPSAASPSGPRRSYGGNSAMSSPRSPRVAWSSQPSPARPPAWRSRRRTVRIIKPQCGWNSHIQLRWPPPPLPNHPLRGALFYPGGPGSGATHAVNGGPGSRAATQSRCRSHGDAATARAATAAWTRRLQHAAAAVACSSSRPATDAPPPQWRQGRHTEFARLGERNAVALEQG